MYLWRPITLRSGVSEGPTVSGVYVVDNKSNEEHVIALSAALHSQLKVRQGRAVGSLESSLTAVIWEDLVLVNQIDLPEVAGQLQTLQSAFTYPEPTFLRFKFADTTRINSRLRAARPLRAASIDSKSVTQQVTITSSPFASAHAALFHGYISSGVISQVLASLVLLDARYLDGMEGGLVNTAQASVGIVLGPLIKSNGEGRLLAAVPWRVLIRHLFPVENHLADGLYSYAPGLWQGVVSILIRRRQAVSWGSGVLIAPDTILTNNHVVRDHEKENIEIWAGDKEQRHVRDIEHPAPGLDLVLMRLDNPILSLEPVTIAAKDAEEGSRVRSVGFGLFLPRPSSLPLESRGIVSKHVPGMLVTSAGCWNGSSGGGLFNDAGDLVGMMASNVRDNTTGEIMPDLSMSIPASVITGAIRTKSVSKEVARLWRLEPSYKEIRAKL